MKTKFDIKPFSDDEIRRIESGIAFNGLSVIFFTLLPGVLIGSFIYGSYQSKSVLMAIFSVVVITGACLFFIPMIKIFMREIKNSKIALEKNEKYCAKGYIQKKWFKVRPSWRNSFTDYYILIDDEEYQIFQESYDELNFGDYVYYEVMHPLYCNVKKI